MTSSSSWNAPLSEALERRLGRVADLGERAISVVLYASLAVRVAAVSVRQPWELAILLPEGLVVVFMILRRRPTAVTTRPWDWLIALIGTASPMLVAPGGQSLIPPLLGVVVIFGGLGFSVWAKLSLRRSFGLAAANRGLVSTGAYGLVRHPIYAGYLLSDVGFLLMNPTARNLGLYALAVGLVLARIRAEERLLDLDPLYAAFKARVRYRLAPGLY
ncbi:MAG TPA: methyltransferase [Caulobacteraceae bacterium]